LVYACIAKGVGAIYFDERHEKMSNVTSRWQQRRQAARTRRALSQALARTSSPAMRDELLTIANR
jgi:hypothetical protein